MMTDDRPILSALDLRADLSGALARWRGLIGEEHVLTDEGTLSRYARSTSATPRRPAALLRPASTEEVIGVVQIAGQHRTPLYPISTGQNWGYGDACAVHEGQVIIELRRMDRIVEVDAELGYAVIEPGVTQQQLADHLRNEGAPFWVDCTGAGPNSSLIGNIVERGFGHTPYGNRFQTVAGMDVVLGNGELLRTGFGQFEGAKATHLYPYGIGPHLDGLFTQSHLGIVTRLGLWLMPIPEKCMPFLVFFKEDQDFFRSIPALRRLRMHRVLHSVPHIGNDLRAFASAGPFPRERVPQGARLPPEVRASMRKQAGIGAWTMSGAFYGTAAEVRWRKRELIKALRGLDARTLFLPPAVIRAGRVAAGWLQRFGTGGRMAAKLEAAEALAGMHMGRPTAHFLKGTFWRHRGPWPAQQLAADTDLARDGVGILWFAPIVPLTREDFERALRQVDSIFEHYGFDCHVTANLINERAFAAVFTVEFDADDEAEARQATLCYQAASTWLARHGYPPYRASIGAMGQALDSMSPVARAFHERLGIAMDPHRIIAPGRYSPEL